MSFESVTVEGCYFCKEGFFVKEDFVEIMKEARREFGKQDVPLIFALQLSGGYCGVAVREKMYEMFGGLKRFCRNRYIILEGRGWSVRLLRMVVRVLLLWQGRKCRGVAVCRSIDEFLFLSMDDLWETKSVRKAISCLK